MTRRWLKFNAVGALGVLVQAGALALLAGGLGLHYAPATAVAVELAVLHNFMWHERFTWKDRYARGATLKRLLRFNLTTGVLSVAGNLALMLLLAGLLGLHYLAANLATIAVLSLANFAVSETVVFTAPGRLEPRQPGSAPRAGKTPGTPARPQPAPGR